MASILVNARYRVHAVTGMQRHAEALVTRLRDHVDLEAPRRPLVGMAGHAWEQFVLPTRLHGRLLWSPNNTGPLAVSRQVCTLHDICPLDHTERFSRSFAACIIG